VSRWGWSIRLILANVIVFLLMPTIPANVLNQLVLVPSEAWRAPWTLVTYMFLHGGMGHVFFNMLSLFFFGPRLESRLGGGGFLGLYFASGVMGALLSLVLAPNAAIIGASGAVFGVMFGYAWFWPRDRIMIWGIIPIEARYLVLLMTGIALYSGFTPGAGGNIAHFAHLGGFLGGFLFLKVMERRSPSARFKKKARPIASRMETLSSAMERWKTIRRDRLHEVNREELDRILDKISSSGIGSLTAGEREFLDRFSTQH
jgi:membrane associated rhomboid family serine protease